MRMKVYEVEVGATYWVAAKNLRQAVDTVWRCWENEGSLADVDEGGTLSVEEVSEERARKLKLTDDDGGGTRSLWDFVRDQTEKNEPEVVGCSEWG